MLRELDGRQRRPEFMVAALAFLFASLASEAGVLELVELKPETRFLDSRSLAITPDGRFLYVGGSDTLLFERDLVTGEISFVDAGERTMSVAIGPDGRSVYSGWLALRVGRLDPRGGRPALVERWTGEMVGLDGSIYANSLVVTPDGAHVYVGTSSSSLIAFERDADNGVLTYARAYYDGAEGILGLGSSAGLAMSPDGAHLYAVTPNYSSSAAVTVFSREGDGGELSVRQSIQHTFGAFAEIRGARSVVVSVDGRHVYVGGLEGVVTFGRDPLVGSLDLHGVVGSSTTALATSADDRFLYAVGDGRIDSFSRDLASGSAELGGEPRAR